MIVRVVIGNDAYAIRYVQIVINANGGIPFAIMLKHVSEVCSFFHPIGYKNSGIVGKLLFSTIKADRSIKSCHFDHSKEGANAQKLKRH